MYVSVPLLHLSKLDLIKEFGEISSYKVNPQKSELMPIKDMTKGLAILALFKMSLKSFNT